MQISKAGIEKIQNEIKKIQEFLKHELEEGVKRGGPMDSFKEAAAVSANLQAHNQKLKDLERIVNNATILPEYIPGNSIILGKWFELSQNDIAKRYRLVETVEADISKGLLSLESPLGKALLGKKSGDTVEINTVTHNILKVE
jgi:transcription elongation factor GreA